MTINGLTLKATPLSSDRIELNDGQSAELSTLPVSTPTTSAIAAHAALTTTHGSTSANTAGRIVQRSAAGVTSLSGLQLDTAAAPTAATGLIRWNDVDKTAEIVTEGGVALQLGQEETVYVRNASGVALVNGDAVYVTGATGQRPTVAKATANSSTAQKMIGLVTTSSGIANNAFGFVTVAGIVRDLDTSAFTDGAELWLSPTVAGALTATQPSGEAQRIMRVGYVLRVHANQGQILVSTHYHGTPLANALMESEGAAAGRTALGAASASDLAAETARATAAEALKADKSANLSDLANAATARANLGLGTLATQSGTFSGTSSGTNTGDQTASTVTNTPAGNIAATTVQAALNELDSEKTTAAAALAAADAAIQSAFTAYSPQGYLNSDGATPNRAQIQGPFDAVNNPRGWVAGAATLEWVGILAIPTTAFPSGQGNRVFHVGPSATPGVWPTFTDSCLTAHFFGNNHGKTGNEFSLNQSGLSTNGFANREWQLSDFRTRYSGRTIKLRIKITAGTSSPYIEVDDVDITSLGTYATSGTSIPDWLASTGFTPTYHLTGYNWPAGPAPVGCFILGSLTDADRAFHRSTGKYPAWVVAGGSMQQRITDTSRNSVFSAAGTDWDRSANGSLAVDNANSELDVTVTGVGRTRLADFYFGGTYVANGRYIVVQFTIANWSMSAASEAFIDVNNTPVSNGLVSGNGTFTLQGFVPAQFYTGHRFCIEDTGTGTYSIKNVKIMFGGALSLPVVQPIAVLDDATTIGGNQARLVGVTPVTDKRDWRISADTWANGNQRLLEGALIDSTADIINTIEQTTTGTPTTTIGSDSAGSQYKASGALTAGINPTTLVTRKAASNEFWVGSNSTAVVRTTIMGHRAN